jgi:hypothetical protein
MSHATAAGSPTSTSTSTPDLGISLVSPASAHIVSVTQVAAGPEIPAIIYSRPVDDMNWSLSTADGLGIPSGTRFSVLYQEDGALGSDFAGTIAWQPQVYSPPRSEDTPAAFVAEINGDERDAPAQNDDLGIEHVASEANIIGEETCIDEFKLQPPPEALFHVTTSNPKRKASARYVASRKLPWCITFDDEGVSVSPGDEFSVNVYVEAPETCGQADSNQKLP